MEPPRGADPVVVLTPERPAVEPGGEVVLVATVHNPGAIVEEYSLEVLGVTAPWTTLDPPALSAMPGASGEVRLTVRPPRDPTTPAGPQPLGLRVVSHENAEVMGVGETDVLVGGVFDLSAQLVPVRDRARWSGKYTLDLNNAGSEAAPLVVNASDSRQGLAFAIAPATVRVEPGAQQQVFLRVRVRSPKLLGKPMRHTFTVTRSPTGPGIGAARETLAGKAEGSFEQLPVLPKWVAVAAALLVVGVVALFAFVLKPDESATAASPLAPPVTGIENLTDSGPTAVRVAWQANPYAKSYEVQRIEPVPEGAADDAEARILAKTKVDDGDSNSAEVKELKPGTRHCFRLVAVNDVGGSAPSGQACVNTPAEAKPSSPKPSDSGEKPPGNGSTDGSSTDDPNKTGTGTGAPERTLEGSYAVAASFPLKDGAIGTKAEEETRYLNARYPNTLIVDGRKPTTPPNFAKTFWYLVVDGYPDRAAADAACKQMKDDPEAPAALKGCYPVQPL